MLSVISWHGEYRVENETVLLYTKLDAPGWDVGLERIGQLPAVQCHGVDFNFDHNFLKRTD